MLALRHGIRHLQTQGHVLDAQLRAERQIDSYTELDPDIHEM